MNLRGQINILVLYVVVSVLYFESIFFISKLNGRKDFRFLTSPRSKGIFHFIYDKTDEGETHWVRYKVMDTVKKTRKDRVGARTPHDKVPEPTPYCVFIHCQYTIVNVRSEG